MRTAETDKLIADFVRLELTGPGFPSGYFYNGEYYHLEDLKFHSSWDWLMPVVDKVTATQNQRTSFEIGDLYDELRDALYDADRSSTYAAVVKIIVWLNENANESR